MEPTGALVVDAVGCGPTALKMCLHPSQSPGIGFKPLSCSGVICARLVVSAGMLRHCLYSAIQSDWLHPSAFHPSGTFPGKFVPPAVGVADGDCALALAPISAAIAARMITIALALATFILLRLLTDRIAITTQIEDQIPLAMVTLQESSSARWCRSSLAGRPEAGAEQPRSHISTLYPNRRA